jgi:transposase
MKIENYTFTEEEIKLLEEYRDKQDDPRLKLRFIALLTIARGVELPVASLIIGKSPYTVKNWFQKYITKGIDCLNNFQYKPKKTYLKEEQINQTVEWVKNTNPATLKEIRAYIQSNFKVTYDVETVRQLLHKRGLKLLRPKIIPGKPPSQTEQEEFLAKYYELKKESEVGTVFLFGDAMHLIYNVIAGLCWGDPANPPILNSNTGRNRLNILGAYNPDTHSFVHLTGEENCDAKRIIAYFELILKKYSSAPKIILFLDNAKYHKAEIVSEWLKKHSKLKIEFLPAYAPNLNLIESFGDLQKKNLLEILTMNSIRLLEQLYFNF